MKEINIKQNWKSLSFKEKLANIFAALSFLCGWTLTALGFFTEPVGIISDSVLIVLGQSLLFTGAVIGIAQYYSSELSDFKRKIMDELQAKNNVVDEE